VHSQAPLAGLHVSPAAQLTPEQSATQRSVPPSHFCPEELQESGLVVHRQLPESQLSPGEQEMPAHLETHRLVDVSQRVEDAAAVQVSVGVARQRQAPVVLSQLSPGVEQVTPLHAATQRVVAASQRCPEGQAGADGLQ
jgi:hypothetical protein